MRFTPLFPLLLILPLTFSSCGNDDDNDEVVQQEEDTSGGTTSGSTGGTSGGTSGGSSGGSSSGGTSGGTRTCLGQIKERNLKRFLNRMASLTTSQGEADLMRRNEDGSTSTFSGVGAFTLTEEDSNRWSAIGGFGNENGQTITAEWRGEIRNGCFYSNNNRYRVISATSTQISFRTRDDEGDLVQDTFSLNYQDQFRILETVTREGQIRQIFRFRSQQW